MTTRIHTADNLYSFIQNARQKENLDAQIASKEEELRYLDHIDEIYAKLTDPAPFDTSGRYVKVALELTELKLQRNKFERQLLEFELAALLED